MAEMPKVSVEQQIQNAARTYMNMLSAWGIPTTPSVQAFANKAVMEGWNSATFLAEVRKTKFYAQRFQGIRKPNGALRMSEAQYISGYESARDYAQSLGRNLPREQYALAIKNGNSPSEIRQKLEAVDKLRAYGPMYRQFGEYLQATGVTRKPPTRKDLLQFALGKGDKSWNEAFLTAQAATQVEGMGFNVDKPAEGGDIGYRGLARLAKEVETLGQSGDFTGVLAQSQKVLNAGDWKAAGLTNKDKVKLALGSREAPQIAARVIESVNVRVAALEATGNNPQMTQGPRGTQMTTGRKTDQASE
jgi:hypothetical protein